MDRLMFGIVAVLTAAVSGVVHAQFVPVPAPPNYTMNPPAANSPLQQQILRNYRSDLQQTQRDLAVRNPSGLSREQIDITRQLNAVDSALNPAPSPTPAPGASEAAPFR